MLGQRIGFRQLIWSISVQQRFQSIAATRPDPSAKDIKYEAPPSWEQARPYNEIPKVSLINYICNMLPGGKYHQKQFPDIALDLRRKYGSVFRLSNMGKEFLISNDPKHFEQVLRSEGPWPERPGNEVLRYYRTNIRKDLYEGRGGLLSTQGEEWAKFRFAVNPILMRPKTVRLYYQKMSNVNKEFTQRIRDIRNDRTFEVPEDFKYEINRWTLESVSVVALDKQLGLINSNRDDPQAKKLFDDLSKLMELAGELELKPSLWRFVATPKFNQLINTMANIERTVTGYVNEAINRLEHEKSDKPDNEKSVLEKLLKTNKQIAIIMAVDMMAAGVDTTTSTFTGALLCLAKNPETQAKLREEIRRILPNKDSDFTEESMKNVPYLRAFIKESLRVFPLTFGNTRVTKSDLVLNGYRVPNQTIVLMLSAGLLTDEQYFPRAKEFLPERWLRTDKNTGSDGMCPHSLKASHPFVYLPFGFGSRMCIGKRIVEMELELGIARLIRNFNIEFNYPTENAFRSEFINVPNIPLKFKFTDVRD